MIVHGDQLRTARARLGWSQTDLGIAAGLHRNAVGYWERHESIRCQNSNGAVARMREAFERAGIRFSEPLKPRRPKAERVEFCRSSRLRARGHHVVEQAAVGAEAMHSSSKHEKPSSPTEARVPAVIRPKQECGAQTRKGLPCKRPAYTNGRCRNHGGLSTGPKETAVQAVASAIAKLTLATDNPVIIDTSQPTSRSSFHTVSISAHST